MFSSMEVWKWTHGGIQTLDQYYADRAKVSLPDRCRGNNILVTTKPILYVPRTMVFVSRKEGKKLNLSSLHYHHLLNVSF